MEIGEAIKRGILHIINECKTKLLSHGSLIFKELFVNFVINLL